jgi:hypothetical protein
MSLVAVRSQLKSLVTKPRSAPVSGTLVMPSTGTNILALPLVQTVIATGNNEDWVDCLQFLVDNKSGNQASFPQLDLRGIDFEMAIRRGPGDAEVIIEASTADGTMAVGAPPNIGFLIWYVSYADVMQYKEAGDYVGDIIALDGNFIRTCVQINPLTIFQGIAYDNTQS